MKQFKKILVTVLMACMVMGLCACGNSGEGDTEKNSEKNTQSSQVTDSEKDSQKESENDGKIKYTVKVVDESGNPIANALVQMCSDTCFPSSTDASGVATFNLAEDEYKVSFLSLPAGYAHAGDATDYYFDGNATDLTITLKKAE